MTITHQHLGQPYVLINDTTHSMQFDVGITRKVCEPTNDHCADLRCLAGYLGLWYWR